MKRKLYGLLLLMAFGLLLLPTGKVQAAKIRLTSSSLKMKADAVKAIKLKGVAAKSVKWSSSNKKVAIVNKGKIKALKSGKTTIKARAKGKTYKCKVTVECALSAATAKLKPGGVKTIELKGISANSVKWSSNNENVALVDNGKITALKGGKATIKAKAKGKTYKCDVTVVSISTTLLTLAKDQKVTLKVTNGSDTKWSSASSSIASVSSKGVVTGKKTGTTTITCKSNGKTFKVKVYVAQLNVDQLKLAVGSLYQLQVKNAGDTCKFTSSNPNVLTCSSTGEINALTPGQAVVTCKTGKAALTCKVTVIAPDNIKTSVSSLPTSTKGNQAEVTINGYPSARTYTVYYQAGNKTDGKNGVKASFMGSHGCAATALAGILSGFKGIKGGPAYVVETVEKKVFGTTKWSANYSKANMNDQRPVSLYGISKILTYYKIPNTYVRSFNSTAASATTTTSAAASTTVSSSGLTAADQAACKEIKKHLLTGNPAFIVVSATNRSTGVKDKLWTSGYHTMALLGIASDGKAIVADPARRPNLIKYVKLEELIPYMISSTNLNSTSLYWNGAGNCGGYILVNPQES